MKKIRFHTLGCKTNQYDSEAMLEILKQAGFVLTDGNDADVVIVNTCTVTAEADRKSRQAIRQAVSSCPEAVIVVAGCYAQKESEEIAAMEGVDIVLGNQFRGNIAEILSAPELYSAKKNYVQDLSQAGYERMFVSDTSEHTRANIKIQEGCNQFCSYCIIPYVRGRIRSRPKEDTVQEVRRLAEKGVHEFVLTGIHIASYGLDQQGKPGLMDLIELLDPIPGVERLRLGSLEPSVLSEEFCSRAVHLRHLCPHFHLSLQSGCSKTLKRMRRKYTAEEFRTYTERIRRYYPEISLTTDVIVGFPGETTDDFEESYSFVREMAFSRIHVFPFSPRPGTAAAEMPDQIQKEEKHRRTMKMIRLGHELLQKAQQRKIGTVSRVLLEEKENGWISGYTDDYMRVSLPDEDFYPGQFVDAELIGIKDEMIVGQRARRV